MYVIKDETMRVPLKVFALPGTVEDGAIEQAKNACRMPMIFNHMALMPDGHQGYGVPIGAVVPLRGAVSPKIVGVDLGCNVRSVKTNIHIDEFDPDKRKQVLGKCRELIPIGTGCKHDKKCDESVMPERKSGYLEDYAVVNMEYEKARYQMSTLGSKNSNHFIEFQKDEDGFVWAMIHSGSRNLGHTVGSYYDKLAKSMNNLWYSNVDPKWDLSFLPTDSDEGHAYMLESEFCFQYAENNTYWMMNSMKYAFDQVFNGAEFSEEYQVAHNQWSLEHHFGSNVVVHRKGAIRAREDDYGIIPGSQGSPSYIIKGKNNSDSLNSASHGAGRAMSRKKAMATLDFDAEKAHMDNSDIVHGIRNKDDLSEAKGAYKDISIVMEGQQELIEVIHELFPIASLKG